MILLVDIGNSRAKWSLWDGATHTRSGVFDVEPTLFPRMLDHEWRGIAAPERVLVSSVAEQKIADGLYLWVQNKWKLHTEFAKSQKQAQGVTNSYVRADRLGVDRWLALIAARKQVPDAPVCVADCGTAVTIDVLDATGQHLGGLIIPGLMAMCGALARGTAEIGQVHRHLPPVELQLANDTQNAVMAGARLAIVATIDRAVGEAAQHLGRDVTLLVTGGDASSLLPLLRARHMYVPTLVLDGLALTAGARA